MRDWEKMIREEWFPEHYAAATTFMGFGTTDVIRRLIWKRPRTMIYGVLYHFVGRSLIVMGDLGDAVYRWNHTSAFDTNPFAWIAACNIGYFHSKCVSSEVGRAYEEWFEEEANRALEEWIADGDNECEGSEGRRARLARSAFRFAADSQADWNQALAEDGEDLFGPRWWEDWPRAGLGIDLRCRAHLIGLKMAVAQLDQAKGQKG